MALTAAQRARKTALQRERRAIIRGLDEKSRARLEEAKGHGVKILTQDLRNLNKQEIGLIATLSRNGVKLNSKNLTAELNQWEAYLTERHAQAKDSKFYLFDKWVDEFEEYKEAREDEGETGDLMEDFNAWKSQQDELEEAYAQTIKERGYNSDSVDVFFADRKKRRNNRKKRR